VVLHHDNFSFSWLLESSKLLPKPLNQIESHFPLTHTMPLPIPFKISHFFAWSLSCTPTAAYHCNLARRCRCCHLTSESTPAASPRRSTATSLFILPSLWVSLSFPIYWSFHPKPNLSCIDTNFCHIYTHSVVHFYILKLWFQFASFLLSFEPNMV